MTDIDFIEGVNGLLQHLGTIYSASSDLANDKDDYRYRDGLQQAQSFEEAVMLIFEMSRITTKIYDNMANIAIPLTDAEKAYRKKKKANLYLVK